MSTSTETPKADAGTGEPRRRGMPLLLAAVLMLAAGALGGRALSKWEQRRDAQLGQALIELQQSTPDVGRPRYESIGFLAPLLEDDVEARLGVLREMKERDDLRAVPAFLEVGLAGWRSHATPISDAELALLVELAGVDHGRDWSSWHSWWWSLPDRPAMHPGFAYLQAELHARIDPVFREILRPDSLIGVPRDELMWGGVRFDAIKAMINAPRVASDHLEAGFYNDAEVVFGAVIGGEAHAWPLRLMDHHEMANDVIGGRPVALMYCSLCAAAVLFDTSATPHGTMILGSSGFLRLSNKVMYDQNTRSLWSSLEGRPIGGPMFEQFPEFQLTKLPVVRTTWGAWKAQHPDTTISSRRTGYDRQYAIGEQYGEYYDSPDPMFPVGGLDARLPAKSLVFGVVIDDEPIAWAMRLFEGDGDATFLLDLPARDGRESRRLLAIGDADRAEVRVFDVTSAATDFAGANVSDDQRSLTTNDGAVWTLGERALSPPAGSGDVAAPRVAGHVAYWFGWRAHYPQTRLLSER